MNTFISFCLDIKRIKKETLLRALECLIRSLDFFNNTYKLIVYTNMDMVRQNPFISIHACVTIVDLNLNDVTDYYFYVNDSPIWHNISFHKLVVCRNYAVKNNVSPIWIDLDTIVCRNIDHLSNYPNFFITQGSNQNNLVDITSTLSVPINKMIQGNIWKVDADLYKRLFLLWDTIKKKPAYDSQSLFTIGYYQEKYDMNLLNDLDIDTINGLDICSPDPNILRHPRIDFLKDNIKMNEDSSIIHVSSGRIVQFFSFTFYTLEAFLNANSFDKFTCPYLKNFFNECGYIT